MLLKCNDKTVSGLYKKLLAFYPQDFREQLGESMQQTFKDLCNERRERTGAVSLSFVLGLLIETAVEMVKQHALVIARRDKMQKFIRTVGAAALISFVLVLPFAILETVNNTVNRENLFGLILLFAVLWLLPTAFIVVLASLVRGIRAGNTLLANPLTLLLRVASLVLIATVWGWGFIDQLPCFLGIPNCD